MIDKRLTTLVKGSKAMIFTNVFVQWLGLCLNIAIVANFAWLLGVLYQGVPLSGGMVALRSIIILGCIAARFATTLLASRLSFRTSETVKLTLREKVYKKLLSLGPAYHEKISTSQAIQMGVEGVDQLEIYFGKYLPQLFYSLLAPVTLFIVLAPISFSAALVLLLCVPLIPVSIVAVQKFAKKLLANYWGKYTSLGDGFLESLQGLTTLKIYNADQAKNEEINQQAEEFRVVTMKVLYMQLNSITVMDLIAYGGAAIGIIVALVQFSSASIGLSGFLMILLLAADFFLPLRLLGSYFHIAMNGMAASDKIFDLLDLPTPKEGTVDALSGQGEITTTKLSYSYDGQRTVLDGVSLEAGPGLTAVVGESGSGKSTLAGILSGQNQGYTGSICWDGVELKDIAPETLSQNITLVSHNSYLFKGTVKENLLMAKPEASDQELWEVLGQVRLREFLKGEKGLETLLTEQAANLSGGQRQRLALARGLLHDTPVYLFDEASSNIDVESENQIAKVIGELSQSKTVLLISHRLANVVFAHEINVLEHGKLVESGTHEELLAQNGTYANLYETQQTLEQFTQRMDVYA